MPPRMVVRIAARMAAALERGAALAALAALAAVFFHLRGRHDGLAAAAASLAAAWALWSERRWPGSGYAVSRVALEEGCPAVLD